MGIPCGCQAVDKIFKQPAHIAEINRRSKNDQIRVFGSFDNVFKIVFNPATRGIGPTVVTSPTALNALFGQIHRDHFNRLSDFFDKSREHHAARTVFSSWAAVD
ncbi:hypothetical protein SDC9_207402 [bioreactor metagenome]|uniref:Uncharacterized protein n=1 Tax=bioreactor metagenome TaxID=1076179 RepID=A0A645J964_9ZZZZ